MKRFFPLLLCLISALPGAGLAQAQSLNQQVYAFRAGDLWRYDFATATVAQLTEWGYNGGPILAPDGRALAYLSTTEAFVASWEAGKAGRTRGTAPADIWLMDIASGSHSRIADQSGAGAAGYLRSLPVWSPDSRQLAWLQLDPNAQAIDAAHLQAHRLDSGITSTLVSAVDLGAQDSEISLPSLRWGAGGIARLLYTYLAGSQSPFLFVEFYLGASGESRRYDLGLDADGRNTVRDFEWVDHQGRSLLALQIQDYWEVIDPQSGARTRLVDAPRLRSRFVSGGLELIPASVAKAQGGWNVHWFAALGGQLLNTGYTSARVNRNYRPGISPDGRQMAWHNGDRISLWQADMNDDNRPLASDASSRHAFPIPEPVSAVWAPTVWVTTGQDEAAQTARAAPPAAAGCDLPARLSIGQQAIVSPGLANRVRSAASLDAERLGVIEAGEIVRIEAGPLCADGYHWYGVSNAAIAGWTVEGSDGEYWLIYHAACHDSPPTRLTSGMTATVSRESALNIRDGIGAGNTNVLSFAVTGGELDITGLPVCDAAGLRWYPVAFEGVAGWVAAGQGEDYWLAPIAN